MSPSSSSLKKGGEERSNRRRRSVEEDHDNKEGRDHEEDGDQPAATTGSVRASRRKRKRRKKYHLSPEDSVVNDDGSSPAGSLKQQDPKNNLPLKGKVVAISTLQQHTTADDDGYPGNDNDDADGDTESSSYNYKSLRALCQRAGAVVSGQVHSRVYCVVATAAAADGATCTQRVRKAWHKRIPVVDVAWVQDCLARGQLRPIAAEDCWEAPCSSTISSTKKTSNQAATGEDGGVNAQKNSVSLVEKHLDLGCCCVCHDEDCGRNSSPREECAWCVGCSVNNRRRAPTQQQQQQQPYE